MAELSSLLKGIRKKEQLWLQRRTGGREDINGYLAVRNHTNCLNLWQLSNSAWDQVLGKIDCVYFISWDDVYILPCISLCLLITQSVSTICVSPYAPRRIPPVKLDADGGEKQIFSPQWPPCAFLSALNQRLHVLLQLHSITVCSQIDRWCISRET